MKLSILISLCFYSGSLAALNKEWWKHTTIYEIFPYTFMDSNGDGIGDIQGIISKVDYLKSLGIGAIHMTPVYKSKLQDMGYDILDYKSVDSRLGTIYDMQELIYELKKRGIKLIMDLVINHSDTGHEWFQKSVKKIHPYTDFYVWKNAKSNPRSSNRMPPNNWASIFSGKPGSAWTWNEVRQQYYLHQFLEQQADFNLRNEDLKKELIKIMEFWLDLGVNGFRMDAVIFFMEDKDFKDGPIDQVQLNQDESCEFTHELRQWLDKYNEAKGGDERIFIAEAHSDPIHVRKYYDRGDYHITHFPYVFYLRYIHSEVTAKHFSSIIENWIKELPPNAVSLWMTQDHDGSRTGTRVRPEYVDILTMTSMLLPGSAGCYYGQEIAMDNGYINKNQIKDHSGGGSRDPARLIMQWDETTNAGFSRNKIPFLPPNTDYVYRNVKLQESEKISHLNMFKDLTDLRKTNISKYGDFKSFVVSEYVYAFTRSYRGQMYIVVINFYYSHSRVDLSRFIDAQDPIIVMAASVNSDYQKGHQLHSGLNNFLMRPYSCLALQADYHNENDEDIDSIYDY